jgi:signal transduction histidine kinase
MQKSIVHTNTFKGWWMISLSLVICLSLSSFNSVSAQTQEKDTAFQNLYKRYYQYYNENDADKFLEASEQMKEYYEKKGNRKSYYKIRLNEVLYEAENGNTYSAINKSNDILKEMEEKNERMYPIVYTALATIYESRGNYRMAKHYYEEALKDAEPTDTGSLMSIYSRVAELKMERDPKDAMVWNEKFGSLSQNHPEYYKVYLALKGGICFFLGDKNTFEQTNSEFQQYLKQHPSLDQFGIETMSVVQHAFNGQYNKALELLSATNKHDFEDIKYFDFRSKIYQMMNRSDLAIAETDKRREFRDSLSSDMFFNNINEVYAELEVAKINQKAAEERELWMTIVIILLGCIVAAAVTWSVWYRRVNKRLKKQNNDLEIALDRAEESDRMKSSFIKQVSHEIRTPLNVITGYAQIITNPQFQLGTQERDEMLNAINKNTSDITEIVNELLEVAQDDSRNLYEKEDLIDCDELCKTVMKETEKQNTNRLEMRLVNDVPAGFTFKSNRTALEKILGQLMNNAVKFTEKGFAELHASYDERNNTLTFTVTDSGIGIPKKHHSHIFHRFFKIDPFKQGLGLGLTMSKKMADLLYAQLYIDSSYTDGCRMVLSFEV